MALTFISSTTNSATVEVYHTYTNGSRVYWDYRVSGSSAWLNRAYTLVGANTYRQYTFDSLQPSTYYEFRARIVNGSNLQELASYTASGATQSITPPKTDTPTNFSMTATKSTEIYFSWSSVSGATKYEVAIYAPFSLSREVTNTFLNWGNLSPETTYYGYVRAYSNAGGWSDWSSYDFAKTPKGKPVDFAWDTSKTSGYNFNLTADEWTILQQKINEFRLYKELTAYNFTAPSKGNILYATYYNEARNAINGMNPPTDIPIYRNSGDIIYASEINKLRDSLNSIT